MLEIGGCGLIGFTNLPTTSAEAVARARTFIGRGTYVLGTGGYRPARGATDDLEPWTPNPKNGLPGPFCDCWGLVSWAFRQRRHCPGYNVGGSVVDDINVDSAIEDATGFKGRAPRQMIWRALAPSESPTAGDLIVWPSIRGSDGKRMRIGHVGILADATSTIQCSSNKPYGAAIRLTDLGAFTALRNRAQFRELYNPAWQTIYLRLV